MSATIIDGKELSARVRAELVTRIQAAGRPVRLPADWSSRYAHLLVRKAAVCTGP